MPFVHRDYQLAISPAALTGPDVWVRSYPLQIRSVFVSRKLQRALDSAGMTNVFVFSTWPQPKVRNGWDSDIASGKEHEPLGQAGTREASFAFDPTAVDFSGMGHKPRVDDHSNEGCFNPATKSAILLPMERRREAMLLAARPNDDRQGLVHPPVERRLWQVEDIISAPSLVRPDRLRHQ